MMCKGVVAPQGPNPVEHYRRPTASPRQPFPNDLAGGSLARTLGGTCLGGRFSLSCFLANLPCPLLRHFDNRGGMKISIFGIGYVGAVSVACFAPARKSVLWGHLGSVR